MNTFISGGCKNGKSMYAQELAREMANQKEVPLYYIATMIPKDFEDDNRVIRHREERDGWGFQTVEQGKDICECLNEVDPKGVFLLDSVTALLENEMFDTNGNVNLVAGNKVKKDLLEFAKRTGETIFVSDYIYGDALEFAQLTEEYRKSLGYIDRALAEVCPKVIEVSYGSITNHKEGY